MKYIRMHQVEAEPMKFGEFKDKYPKSGGANVERGANDDGYVIFYRGGEYVSWCPKKEFEDVSRPCDGMTFGMAVEAMKRGWKVTRLGWNGKGMYIWVMPGSTVRGCNQITDPHLAAIDKAEGEIRFLGSICMHTEYGDGMPGWLASPGDVLAEDWEVVE